MSTFGFFWRSSLLAAGLAALSPSVSQAGSIAWLGAINRFPYSVSRDGSAVAGDWPTQTPDVAAFRWTLQSGLVDLGNLGGVGAFGDGYSEAFGISGDGAVVVGWSFSASGIEAYRWTSGSGMVGLERSSIDKNFPGLPVKHWVRRTGRSSRRPG